MGRPIGYRVVFFILLLLVYGISTIRIATASVDRAGSPDEVITLVNQIRESKNLASLQANSALMRAAQAHSEYMASTGQVSHTGAGGSRPVDRAIAAGYGGGARVFISENIYAGNGATPAQAVSWWAGDSLHLETILSAGAVDAGAGVAEAEGVVYYTLQVGYVSGQAAPTGSSGVTSMQPTGASQPSTPAVQPVVVSTPRADGSIVHIVQQGQALWNIAATYKISLKDLLDLNGLTENSVIHPGDELIIVEAQGTTGEATETPQTGASPTPLAEGEALVAANAAPVTSPLMGSPTPERAATASTTAIGATDTALPATPASIPAQPAGSQKDPLLVVIVVFIVIGTGLIVFGSLVRR